MEVQKYRLVTTGEIHAGFSLQEVQKNLSSLYKGDTGKLERIFSGNVFVLVTDVDLITARRHKTSLEQTGIVCQIEPLTPIFRNQEALHQPQRGSADTEKTGCPKCGAPYQGQEVCASCGIIPAKYRERPNVGILDSVQPEEGGRRWRRIRITLLLLVGVILIATAYLLPKSVKYELSDWYDRRTAPNFELPPTKFPFRSQSDIIREYNARGYTLNCYGNLNPEEKATPADDFVCWFPIKTAYTDIPASRVAFFFSEEQVTTVRVDFPDSSSSQVNVYLQNVMINERRLDTLPEAKPHLDIYGVPLITWEIDGGFVQTPSRGTPGHPFIVVWARNKSGSPSAE